MLPELHSIHCPIPEINDIFGLPNPNPCKASKEHIENMGWIKIKKYRGRISALVLIAGFILLLARGSIFPHPAAMSYTDLQKNIAGGQVTAASFSPSGNNVEVTLKGGTRYHVVYPTGAQNSLTTKMLNEKPPPEVTLHEPSFLQKYEGLAIWIILLMVLYIGVQAIGPRLMKLANNKAMKGKRVEIPSVTLADVHGQDAAVAQMRVVIDYLRNPDKYRAKGVRPPRGYLLKGGPGTGKTLLARALAGEAQVPFYAVSGTDFVEIFVGQGASRVRSLFEAPRNDGGAAIIFIDEIDQIGRRRTRDSGPGQQEIEGTMMALCTEIEGFIEQENVIVIAATNQPDVLDPALSRPGRLTRHIWMIEPDIGARVDLLRRYAAELKNLDPGIDLQGTARLAYGMAGAGLKEVAAEAGMRAFLRGPEELVTAADFDWAVMRQWFGDERPVTGDRLDDDRRRIAFHEAGHALCAALFRDAQTPTHVSIVRLAGSGGHTVMQVDNEFHILTLSEIHAQLATLLGGRAGELLLSDNGDFSIGASDDLQRATEIACGAICQAGMGKSLVASRSVSGDHEHPEVNDWLQQALTTAIDTLKTMRPQFDELVRVLLEQETVGGSQLSRMCQDWLEIYEPSTPAQMALA
jgi:cell division protease FtsH